MLWAVWKITLNTNTFGWCVCVCVWAIRIEKSSYWHNLLLTVSVSLSWRMLRRQSYGSKMMDRNDTAHRQTGTHTHTLSNFLVVRHPIWSDKNRIDSFRNGRSILFFFLSFSLLMFMTRILFTIQTGLLSWPAFSVHLFISFLNFLITHLPMFLERESIQCTDHRVHFEYKFLLSLCSVRNLCVCAFFAHFA